MSVRQRVHQHRPTAAPPRFSAAIQTHNSNVVVSRRRMRRRGAAFAYRDERHAREHHLVKVGLLLSCLPLLLTMLGVPLVLEDAWSPLVQTDLAPPAAPVSAEPLPAVREGQVPPKWLRDAARVTAGPSEAAKTCMIVPRWDKALPQKLKHIRVIGERHSGVDGVTALLARSFPNVTVGSGFVRGKYWFQEERLLDGIDLENVLVVVVLRNPYDWIALMQRSPINAPAHRLRHDWRKFVSKPWTIQTSITDNKLSQTVGAKCQAKFLAGEVKPCRQRRTTLRSDWRTRSSEPLYEMHPVTHKPIANILELRKQKLINYAQLTQWVSHVSYLKSESLSTERGTERVITLLAKAYNLDTCRQIDGSVFPFVDLDQRPPLKSMSPQMKDYLTCNVFWSVEDDIFGYSPENQIKRGQCERSPYATLFLGNTLSGSTG